MANAQQLAILLLGVERWNEWRLENPEILPDLRNADLSQAKLTHADLSRANLSDAAIDYATLSNAKLRDARMSRAKLRYADLSRADLRGADLSGADLVSVNLINARLANAKLHYANLSDASLRYADLNCAELIGAKLNCAEISYAKLMGANLRDAQLINANLIDAQLIGASLRDAYISRANLSGSNLSGADLSGADLGSVKLINAKLAGAMLRYADLSHSHLSGSDMSRADMSYADLRNANFSGVNVQGADFANASIGETIFAKVDLSSANGLASVRHNGPSSVGLYTLYESGWLIPEAFLRGCGLSDWEIESTKLYNPDLSNEEINDIQYRIHDLRVSRAFQINPLFISYSHRDGAFVDMIGKHFARHGIRFWRDTDHATAGRLETQVDGAIHLNDIVLLVLSEHSTNSDWVEHEARKAREKERKTGKDALCPVALDESWKFCRWPERLKEQIMEYHILDFSNWQDDNYLERMLRRLLEGLNLFYK